MLGAWALATTDDTARARYKLLREVIRNDICERLVGLFNNHQSGRFLFGATTLQRNMPRGQHVGAAARVAWLDRGAFPGQSGEVQQRSLAEGGSV